MKKKLLLFIAIIAAFTSISQPIVNTVYADTFKITKRDNTPAEFILKNASKNITGGVLTNIGNGKTQFITPSIFDSTPLNLTARFALKQNLLGYTPYNATNPSGYISSITSGNVTTALGFTPYNATNPSGYITSSSLSPYLTTAIAASTYQPLLVSGTTIKTINSTSLLGSGNVAVGTVTTLTRTNGLGITATVTNATTTPNVDINVDTANASILSRQRAAATYQAKLSSYIDSSNPHTFTLANVIYTGTTAPTGANTTLSWVKIGKIVTVTVAINYATAGTAISKIQFDLPSEMPTPATYNGNANTDVHYPVFGGNFTAGSGYSVGLLQIQLISSTWRLILSPSSGTVNVKNTSHQFIYTSTN